MITVNYSVVLYCYALHFRERRGQNQQPPTKIRVYWPYWPSGKIHNTNVSNFTSVLGGGGTGDMSQKNSKPSKPPSKYVALTALYFCLSVKEKKKSYTVFRKVG